MDLQLRGARVIVTAGAAGIGLAVAEAFAAEGARVAVCDVDEEALAAVGGMHPDWHARRCDVADDAQVADFVGGAVAALGGLDTLVNNAGIAGPTARVEDIEPADWRRCLDVCLGGQFHCARHAVAHLRASANPSIANLSSAAGRLGFPLRTPYAAAKWGVVGFTKSLAAELGDDAIRVNAILPGLVAGERQRRVLEAKARTRGVSLETIEREAFSSMSVREYVTAEQIADQILFLASPRARTITGQAISVCGDVKRLV